MKVPSLSKVESVALIGGIAIAAYLTWRLYSAGSSIKDSVATTMGNAADAAKSTWDKLRDAANSVGYSGLGQRDPGVTPQPDDQSSAETARLQRLNQEAQYNGMPDIYDPDGNVKPEFDPTQPTVMGLNNEVSQPAPDYSPEPFTHVA